MKKNIAAFPTFNYKAQLLSSFNISPACRNTAVPPLQCLAAWERGLPFCKLDGFAEVPASHHRVDARFSTAASESACSCVNHF